MTIRSFEEDDASTFFKSGKAPQKKGWAGIQSIVKRKLDMLHYASDLKDLRSPPGNRLEPLSGNLEGFYSIRINGQWRIVFRWDKEAFDVRIMDYH